MRDVYNEVNNKYKKKENCINIFKKFYKCKEASRNSIGIELALSKAIIETDNGKITVKSEKERGITFIIKYYK